MKNTVDVLDQILLPQYSQYYLTQFGKYSEAEMVSGLDGKKVTLEGAYMEVLMYYFPEVSSNSTVLRLHWGSTIVPLNLTIE